MLYKRIEGSRGSRYMADNRFVTKDSIPLDVLMQLDKTSEVKFSGCIFCGKEAVHKRLVTKLMVDLCDEHYFNTTIGQIVAQLRIKGEKDVHEAQPQRSSS